jgi:hypothetical protein
LPGFVPPYEITRIVRSAGFDPLAPPRREGTTYVLRATDFRGILMRVVVDARSGAIRAVNRIVPAGPYGAMAAGPYGPPPYGAPPPYAMLPPPPPYGPPDMMGPEMSPEEADLGAAMGAPGPPPSSARSSMYPPASSGTGGAAGANPATPSAPPLPRPRPAGLAAHEAQPPAKPPEPRTAKPEAAPAASSAPAAGSSAPAVTAPLSPTTTPAAPKRPPSQSPAIPD